MRCAMILRICVMGTISPGIGAGAGVGAALGRGTPEVAPGAAGAGAGAAGVADACFSRKAMTSCLVMRPPKPVPGMWERSMSCSRAILRTRGDERTCSSSRSRAGSTISFCLGGSAGFVAAASLRSGAAAAGLAGADGFEGAEAAGAASPSPEMVPTTVFT